MTRTEAIKIFKQNYCENTEKPCMMLTCNNCAIHMAINSLKAEQADEYIPKSVIEDIKADILYARESPTGSYEFDNALDYALKVIERRTNGHT